MNKDKIAGAAFAALGALIVIMASGIVEPANLSEPGPRLFPYIAGAGICICGVGMFFSKSVETGAYLDKAGWKRLGIIAAVLVAYYFALTYIGFLFGTPFFAFTTIMVLSSGKKVSKLFSAILSVGVTLLLYFLFKEVFMIFLPAGILF